MFDVFVTWPVRKEKVDCVEQGGLIDEGKIWGETYKKES